MCNDVLSQMMTEIKTRLNSPLHMIWSGKSVHLEGYMNPLAIMPSSSVGYLRKLLVWYSIKRPHLRVMLRIIGDKNKSKTIYQITLSEYLKVWRLIQS